MLTFDHIGHVYGTHRAVDDVSFTVGAGEMVCLVGASGCGKTTLLRAAAGLLRPTAGAITFGGDPIDGVPPGLALVSQNYGTSLMPWLTATGNVTFALGPQRLGRTERRARAAEALDAVGLADSARKHPWQLSGGMQQRVAIARALACRPRLLLMDEPFGSLDAHTRADLEDLLRALQHTHAMTVLVVTHDIDEAVYLGDRVVVLSGQPSRVLMDLRIDLPRSRDQVGTRGTAEFAALRTEVARLIRGPAKDRTGQVTAG